VSKLFLISIQTTLLLTPPILLVTTYFVYKGLASRFGPQRGYLGGFLFYWICWCFILPFLTIGPGGLKEMFQPPQPQFGKPAWLGPFLLITPPLVIYLTSFPAEIKKAGMAVILSSALFALANGTMEEVLWRGSYITAFPNSWLWAYIYPSIWFGLWHLAPQVIYPSNVPGGALAFAFMSIFLGLTWGWVAKTSNSIQYTIVAHIFLNFAGLAGKSFIQA